MKNVQELLIEAYKLFREQAGTYLGYSAWMLIPLALISLMLGNQEFVFAFIPIFIIDIFVAFWIIVILIILTDQFLKQTKQPKEPDYKSLKDKAKEHLGPFISVSILCSWIVTGGLLLLIIPGLIFLVWYGFAQLIVILEKKRGFAALSASRELVRGRFWPVAWRLVAGPFAIWLIFILLIAPFLVLAFYQGGSLETMTPGPYFPYMSILEEAGERLLVAPLCVIYIVLLYRELKAKK